MSSRAWLLALALALGATATPRAAGAAPKGARGPAAEKATPPAPAPRGSPFKLKPGAEGQVCLDCHADFAAKLAKAAVHSPVRKRECTGCHAPHAAAHGKLLAAGPTALCATCHGDVAPRTARSVHKPAAEGRCGDCHDPHASEFRSVLVRGGNDLCAGCHADVVTAARNAKHKHQPVEQGCTRCHDPHGSPKAPSLLSSDVPGLCLGCHKVESPAIAKKHMGYPVKDARCTTCHDPHGSSAPGLLYATVHPPVAKGLCAMCHEAPTSKTPLKTRQAGASLCRTCHAPRMAKMLDANRVHQPVAKGDCLACHGPHASKEKGLLKAGMVTACGACHADTIARQEHSPTRHQPVRDGQCTECHDPHSGSAALLFVSADGIELCGKCHDWQKHSTHPIGRERKDPRNRNLTLECASCHRAHGAGGKHLLPYAKSTELCTKCHEQYRR
jgi:DmsE family decaheme c-type cytochrome